MNLLPRRLGVLAVCLVASAVVLTVPVAGPASAAPPLLPSQDPFYAPPAGYADQPLGAILRSQVVTLGLNGRAVPAWGTQLLYRTTDQFGKASAAVTTVISPVGAAPSSPRRIISYHAFYDALGSQCDPSYTLRGGTNPNPPVDFGVISSMLLAGFTVVVPDYEGLKLRWTMSRESAYAALDGIRAAERHLRIPSSTPVGLFGYSGGSIPTGFGAELAPRYAPELNIIAAAAGGVLVNPKNNLGYVDGSSKWAGVIPALMTVYNETFDLNMQKYLSPYGSQVMGSVGGRCITQFASKYPGLTDEQLIRPAVGGLLNVPGMQAAAATNIMGREGLPRSPMMLGIGERDGVGDGIMLLGDVEALARSYCARGVPTRLKIYHGLDHTDAFLPWSVEARAFLGQRFAGQATGRC